MTAVLKFSTDKVGGPTMKWFKHYTGMSKDPKMEELEAAFGLEGYAFYCKILEYFSFQYDGVSAEFDFVIGWVNLQNLVRMKRKRIQDILDLCTELGFWITEQNTNVVRFHFPKLVELRHKDSITSKDRRATGGPKAGLDKELRLKDKEEEGSAPTGTLPRLAIIWNENCGDLPRVLETHPARTRNANARLTERSEQKWVEIIQRIAKSLFCRGLNERRWQATFDWLLNPRTAVAVLEGNFDNQDGTKMAPLNLEGIDFNGAEGEAS
jgi:hypothetical protein